MSATDATPRQLEVLAAIVWLTDANGFPPTLRELGIAMDIRSTNGVNDHLKALQRKGLIRREPLKSRSIVVVRP